MKKRIEQLLNGKFIYEQPELLFSQDRIFATLKAGETTKDEIYFGTDDNRRISGFVTSSDRRLVPGFDRFSGTTVRMPYGVDAEGMKPGESFEGWLCFTTSIGEYKLPFTVQVQTEEVKSAGRKVSSLEEFLHIAKEDFHEAYRIFTERHFSLILSDQSEKIRSLYAGMSQQPVTYQHLEEFLIAAGAKEKVTLNLNREEAGFYDVSESVQESLYIHRSGWGHLRADIEVNGDFLEAGKHVVTEEDFIGSTCEINYVIRQEKLGKGNQYGEIIVKTPYQKLVYHVLASRGTESAVNLDLLEKQYRIALMKEYLGYLCKRTDFQAWTAFTHEKLDRMGESGLKYPEYQLLEAYLLHLEGEDDQASEILERYQNKSFHHNELELAGIYLYLCTQTGLYRDKEQALRKVQNFRMQKEDSFILLKLAFEMDHTLSPSKKIFLMEELFERGCTSPFLYLEAWNSICADMSLLHRINGFWAQVFLFAGKEQMLTEELVMRLAYLSGYEKAFNESLYRAMAMGCEAFPSDDTVEAICKYIMKGNPRKPEYFQWFSAAVDRGIRITRLYEYYVETLDTSYRRVLPKPLLMYFTYNNNTLGDSKRAYLYACIIAGKERDPQTYESYRESMEEFAFRKLREGRMNENYAAVYQEFMREPSDSEKAQVIASRMFTHRLYTDDPKVRSVIVRHRQMKQEEIYPCIHGIAYPRICSEDAAVVFQDEKQRRYAATVDYNLTPLFDDREMVPAVLEKGADEPAVLLHYCQGQEISRKNLGIFQKLVLSPAFTDEYKRLIRKKILDYYRDHVQGEDLDACLEMMDYREYAMVDRKTLLEILIQRGLFPQAMSVVEAFGFEGVEERALLKLVSRMIIRCDCAEDEELIALSSHVYRQGLYDEVILMYLMKFRFGPVDELLDIWKSACGFEMDTYNLEERILSLLMFNWDYRPEGADILKAYIRHSGKESVIGAYLTLMSYGMFVKEMPEMPGLKEYLKNRREKEWPGDRICDLTLLKLLSEEKTSDEENLEMEEKILSSCVKEGMTFEFFRNLDQSILRPYQLDDKTFVEYHTSPEASVTLYYSLDTGLGTVPDYKSEPLKNIYEGIFARAFTLFYGETLRYYFQIEDEAGVHKTEEKILTMNQSNDQASSKYQLINQILCARKLDKETEVKEKLAQYLRQEQYVNEMFVIEKEPER